MELADRIRFQTRKSGARILSPLEDYREVVSNTEYRVDPLTDRVAIIGLNLAGKRSVLYGETDEAVLNKLVEESEPGCFFCPQRVEAVTPRYPADVMPGDSDNEGRLRRGESLLFPNLFPLTDFHAVIALGHRHHRSLDEFPPELITDGLALGVQFIGEITTRHGEPHNWVICCNYLPPGGASIVHPHLQILGSAMPLTTHATELEWARAYRAKHGTCYFDDLVTREEQLGERTIARHGSVTWLAAFAPRGNTELLGICADVAHLQELTDDHIAGLAAGLSQGLRAYAAQKYSTFNFCLYAAPSDDDSDSFRVYASLVSRQSLAENYRCDDYFLQKMLGSEILVDTPEEVAAMVRAVAGG